MSVNVVEFANPPDSRAWYGNLHGFGVKRSGRWRLVTFSKQAFSLHSFPSHSGIMYDIIGDIHGCADELVELLERLGYSQESSVFRHPERKVIFCGDFIDRGPQICDVLNICRSMCQQQAALAVMGNHELNALAYHTPDPFLPGEFLRRHTEHNNRQIAQTLQQLSALQLRESLDWFRTLPACLELPELRVVHACWDPADLALLQRAAAELGWMTDAYLHKAARSGTDLFRSIERVMKGPEMRFPNGVSLTDREGLVRKRGRIRWFDDPAGYSFSDYMFPSLPLPEFEGAAVPGDVQPCPYPRDARPLFFGHYWLRDRKPAPIRHNLACLDYSIARDGMLTAYRFHGSGSLVSEHFVTVPRRSATPV